MVAHSDNIDQENIMRLNMEIHELYDKQYFTFNIGQLKNITIKETFFCVQYLEVDINCDVSRIDQ